MQEPRSSLWSSAPCPAAWPLGDGDGRPCPPPTASFQSTALPAGWDARADKCLLVLSTSLIRAVSTPTSPEQRLFLIGGRQEEAQGFPPTHGGVLLPHYPRPTVCAGRRGVLVAIEALGGEITVSACLIYYSPAPAALRSRWRRSVLLSSGLCRIP